MLCPVCSNQVDAQSAFCNRCGTPMTASAAPEAAVPPSAGYTTVPPSASAYASAPPPAGAGYPPPPLVAGSGLSNNAASAIAYITIIPAIIFLVLEPYNRIPLVRFHAWQSIALTGAAIVLHIVLTICGLMLHFIPLIGLLLFPIHMLVSLAIFVAWLICILKASKGEWYKLPVIGEFAASQAGR
ncbi:MAG TPA: hypothetical protein VGD62_04265 [Acidobacteriaceae bacterium]